MPSTDFIPPYGFLEVPRKGTRESDIGGDKEANVFSVASSFRDKKFSGGEPNI